MKKIICVLLIFLLCFEGAFAMSFLDSRGRITVLMYHRICNDKNCNSDYCITSSLFEEDLKYFKKKGYTSVFASELENIDTRGKKLVVITFDDGYKSDIEYAAPLLEKYGFCATFYIFGGAIGKEGYLTKEDLKSLSKKSFCEIGNHTYKLHSLAASTLNLMYSNEKYSNAIIDDFNKNTKFLENVIGDKIKTASYPNGEYSALIDKKLKLTGIKTTFSTRWYSFCGVSDNAPIGRKNRSKNESIENLMK